MYIDKISKLVKEYTKSIHRTIKIKPIDTKSDVNIGFPADSNTVKATFIIRDHVRISKCKKIFSKVDKPNCMEDVGLKKLQTNQSS